MKTFLCACLVLLFGGCGQEAATVLPANPRSLLGDWVLVSPQTGYRITLQIKPDPNYYTANILPPRIFMVSGKGPVNQYNSVLNYAPDGAKAEERRLRIDPSFTSTLIAENAQQAAAAANYLGSLGQAQQYELTKGGQLRLFYNTLYRPSTPPVLIYQRQ